MNNFEFLNIINAQIVYTQNIENIPEINNQYMLCVSAFVGFHKNLACSIFIKINDKVLSDSTNNGLYELITLFQHDLLAILFGKDNFVIGEDYFISESLYDYIINLPDYDNDDSSSSSVDNSSVIDNSDSSNIVDSSNDSSNIYDSSYSSYYDSSEEDTPDTPDNPDVPQLLVWPPGIVVVAGPDVNYTLSLTQENADLLTDLYNQEHTKARKKKILKKVAPIFAPEINIEDDFTEEEQNEVEETLKNEFVLPDYILYYSDPSIGNPDYNFTIKQNYNNYKDISNINNKDISNIDYFNNDNESNNKEYSREEIVNIPKTFFNIILTKAIPQNVFTTNNQIYNAVMNYWKNGGFDDASIGLNLILGTLFATSTDNMCGCNTITGQSGLNNITTDSCKSMYDTAMKEWLMSMLGDIEYYYDWFFMPDSGKCPVPNTPMIDMLIALLKQFIDAGYDLSFDSNNNLHLCSRRSTNSDGGACNYLILENYIKVLNWVKNNDIDANTNKIKLYGSKFGELLPKLQF